MRGQVGARVAAQNAERQVRGPGRIGRGHARMRVLLELERHRPVVLDRIAQAMQRADARIAAPGEDELARTAHADQLVVDDVGRHPHERQLTAPLPDQLLACRIRDEVREALERHHVAVAHELGDGFTQRDDRQFSDTLLAGSEPLGSLIAATLGDSRFCCQEWRSE